MKRRFACVVGPAVFAVYAVACWGACGSDDAQSAEVPVATCAADSECDDRLDCTVDVCRQAEDGGRFCEWLVASERCFVNGVCAQAGAARPGSQCQVCDAQKPFVWSEAPAGTACDDGSACSEGDACAAGVCGGTPVDCGDANACTRDDCDAASGCTHAALDGYSCDDGVRCTVDDRCQATTCAGRADACDDGDPCSVDRCSEAEGCAHAFEEGLACEDGDACSAGDACRAGACQAGAATNCDDGNSCTIDLCDVEVGCVHLPTQSPCCIGAVSACDDGDVCTDDGCEVETGACVHTKNRAACDDRNACTSGDACADGVCVGGADSACNDGNECTADSCNPSLAELCLHEAVPGGCADGVACTTDDSCADGVCRGDASACVCVPDLSGDGVKLTSIQIGQNGTPGEGLDVDQDASTCAPAGCSGGVDNALSILASLANDPLAQSVGSGQTLIVVEIGSLTATPIEVAVYQASLAPGSEACAVQSATCDWLVDPSFLDATTCEPVARVFATLTGNRLAGGGPGTRLPFSIPFEGASLEVVVANLSVALDVTVQNGQVTSFTGLLGGAVPKATLLEGLRSLPDDALPISKEAALSLVETLVQNDVDSDADGVKDAASIGLKLIAIDGRIAGVLSP